MGGLLIYAGWGGKTDPKMSISHQFLILSRYQQKLNTESTTAGHLNISPRALVCVYTQGRRACRYKVCRVVKSAPWQWVLRATRCQYLIILSKRLRLRSIPLCDRLSVQPFSQATEKREWETVCHLKRSYHIWEKIIQCNNFSKHKFYAMLSRGINTNIFMCSTHMCVHVYRSI